MHKTVMMAMALTLSGSAVQGQEDFVRCTATAAEGPSWRLDLGSDWAELSGTKPEPTIVQLECSGAYCATPAGAGVGYVTLTLGEYSGHQAADMVVMVPGKPMVVVQMVVDCAQIS